MRRPVGKHKSSRYVVVCVLLLWFCLLYDYFWASSPRFTSVVSDWSPTKAFTTVILPNCAAHDATAKEKARKSEKPPDRKLSATFADLPGPELEWKEMAPAPVPRLDGAAIQIKNLFFVFAGYGTIDYDNMVPSAVDLHHTLLSWILKPNSGKIFLPYQFLGMLQQHSSGEVDCMLWVVARRIGIRLVWRSGVSPLRMEQRWRRSGGMKYQFPVEDLIGGQEGDFMAKPESPIFKCSRRNEV